MITLEKGNQVYTVSEDSALYRQLKDNGFGPVEKSDEVEGPVETEKPKTKKSIPKEKGAD